MEGNAATSEVIELDDGLLEAKVGCHRVALTPNEFHLLTLLSRRRNQILPGECLMTALWGSAGPRENKRLGMLVSRLRQKLDTMEGCRIETVRSRGYGLSVPGAGA